MSNNKRTVLGSAAVENSSRVIKPWYQDNEKLIKHTFSMAETDQNFQHLLLEQIAFLAEKDRKFYKRLIALKPKDPGNYRRDYVVTMMMSGHIAINNTTVDDASELVAPFFLLDPETVKSIYKKNKKHLVKG